MNGITNLCTPHMPLPTDKLSPVILRLSNVAMTRGQRQVLSDVNLGISQGDFLAVTGPNGGGKTTLIRIILGLLKPSSGKVERLQHNLRTGYLPQKSSIDSSYPITVREVITSGLLGCGHSKAHEQELTDRMLELVELTGHASKPIGALSGGQQQRALLGRAIISNPQLLVLDEPLSYVDKHFENKIYKIIESLASRTTIVMVSHEISTIATMANRHIIVNGTITECRSAHHFAKIALCD